MIAGNLTYHQDEYADLDQDVLETFSEDVEYGEYIRLDQDDLKTSWRRLLKTKTKDVFKTSSSRRMFASTNGILIALTELLEQTLPTLKVLLGQTFLPQVCLLGQIELTLTGLAEQALLPVTSLLGRAILEVIGLLKRTLLAWMGLLVRTEQALTSLLEQTLLSRIGLPGRTERILTDSKINLRTYFTMGLSVLQTGLRTDTLQGNMGISFWFKLKPVSQANNFEMIDTILLILLVLRLMELYIDTANLVFPSSIRYNLSVKNRFGVRDPSYKALSVWLIKPTPFNLDL